MNADAEVTTGADQWRHWIETASIDDLCRQWIVSIKAAKRGEGSGRAEAESIIAELERRERS